MKSLIRFALTARNTTTGKIDREQLAALITFIALEAFAISTVIFAFCNR